MSLKVYLNLAERMKLTSVDQLWVADRWSRRVIGWQLDRTLAARLAVTALERAIALRNLLPEVSGSAGSADAYRVVWRAITTSSGCTPH